MSCNNCSDCKCEENSYTAIITSVVQGKDWGEGTTGKTAQYRITADYTDCEPVSLGSLRFTYGGNISQVRIEGKSFVDAAENFARKKMNAVAKILQDQDCKNYSPTLRKNIVKIMRNFPVWRFIDITDATMPPQSCLVDVLSLVKEITGKKYVPETDQWYSLDRKCCKLVRDCGCNEKVGFVVEIYDHKTESFHFVDRYIDGTDIKGGKKTVYYRPLNKSLAITALELAKDITNPLRDKIDNNPCNSDYADFSLRHNVLKISLDGAGCSFSMYVGMVDQVKHYNRRCLTRGGRDLNFSKETTKPELAHCHLLDFEFPYHTPKCIDNQCDNCSVGKIDTLIRRLDMSQVKLI
jgi:hypothetical protein